MLHVLPLPPANFCHSSYAKGRESKFLYIGFVRELLNLTPLASVQARPQSFQFNFYFDYKMISLRLSATLISHFLVASFATLTLAHAQTPPTKPTPPRVFLYEIIAPAGGEQPAASAHLLFTLPFAKSDFYPLSDEVMQAYKNADTVTIEADISDERRNSAAAQVLRYAKKDHLKRHLTPTTWASLNKMLGKQAQQFRNDHATSVAMGLRMSVAMDFGYQVELATDLHFIRAAKHDGKSVVELDSIEARNQRLASLSDKEADAYLGATLKAYQNGELSKETLAIEEAWRNGEQPALTNALSIAINRDLGSQKIHALLFAGRNPDIAEQLHQQAGQNKKVFAILDVARLVGEKSILRILEDKGYRIQRVTP